jgi:hypothetical protein
MLRKIRLCAAIALLCAMFMPLSECSGSSPKTAQPAAKSIPRQLISSCDHPADCKVVAKELDISWDSALKLFAFTWPLALLLAIHKWSGRRFTWLLHVLELLLCGGTLYMLWGITLFGELRYGSTVVMAALAAYACAALAGIILVIRATLSRRNIKKE